MSALLTGKYEFIQKPLKPVPSSFLMSWSSVLVCSYLSVLLYSSSRGLVGLVATKSHACHLLGCTGWDWVRIPLGLNFSGSACGVSGHA